MNIVDHIVVLSERSAIARVAVACTIACGALLYVMMGMLFFDSIIQLVIDDGSVLVVAIQTFLFTITTTMYARLLAKDEDSEK